jgi:hypothetical protein
MMKHEFSIGIEMKLKDTHKEMNVPLPLQQLQTPEQNGGAGLVDALAVTATVG